MPDAATGAMANKAQVPREPAIVESVPSVLRYSVLCYAAAVPWETVATPFGTPAQWTGLALFVVWFFALVTGRISVRVPFAIVSILSVLVIWTSATYLWSWAPSITLVKSMTAATLVLASLIVAMTSSQFIPRLLQVLALSCTAMALVVIASAPGANSAAEVTVLGAATRGPAQATFDDIDQNILAFNLVIGFAAAVVVARYSTSTKGRVLFISSAAIICSGVLLTGSRTGLGSLALILIIAASLFGRGRFAFVVITGLGMVWIGFQMLLSSHILPERLELFVDNPILIDNRAAIIDQYQQYQDIWNIGGVGAGADADFLLTVSGWYKNAHSGFWKVWIETGFVGLMIWAVLLVVVIISAYRSPARNFLLVASGAVAAFMLTLGPLNSNVLWLLIGLALIPTQTINGADPPRSRKTLGEQRAGRAAIVESVSGTP